MTLREIAALLDAALEGDPELAIHRVSKIEEAGPGDVTFIANPKYAKYAAATKASALIAVAQIEALLREPQRKSAEGVPA